MSIAPFMFQGFQNLLHLWPFTILYHPLPSFTILYHPLPAVLLTSTPIYRMYNPIYDQLQLVNGHDLRGPAGASVEIETFGTSRIARGSLADRRPAPTTASWSAGAAAPCCWTAPHGPGARIRSAHTWRASAGPLWEIPSMEVRCGDVVGMGHAGRTWGVLCQICHGR